METKSRAVVPIRHLDRSLYQRVRFEAIRRKVNVARLINEMMEAWLKVNETQV